MRWYGKQSGTNAKRLLVQPAVFQLYTFKIVSRLSIRLQKRVLDEFYQKLPKKSRTEE